MPVRKTAEQASAKWVSGMGNAAAAISAGVDRVTVAPGQRAAAKFDKWVQGVQNSQQKWRQRVASVSLEDWKASMKDIGASRAAAGAQAKRGKMEKFMNEFIQHLQNGATRIDGMPDTTYEQRKAKALAQMDHNHAFKRS